MSERRFLELIDHLYAAPGSQAGWSRFLDQLRMTLHGATANLVRHDVHRRRGDMLVTSGSDPDGTRQYLDRWSREDPWAYSPNQRALAHESVIVGEQLVAHADLQKTAFYNDFARHYDVVRMIGGVIEAGRSASSVLSVSRSERQLPFGDGDVRLLEALVPHIRQAVILHQRLVASEAAVSTLTEVVNRSSTAMLFVNSHAEVTFMNEAGARLVGAGDGLLVEQGELRAAAAADTRRLRQCIDAVANLHRARTDVTVVVVQRPSGKRPLAALICPVTRPEIWPMRETTVATIVISDPERRLVPDAGVLRQTFELTPAETMLASLLAMGLTLQQAASALRLTRETVRSRLKTIFQKTSTHRQTELVRLLLQYSIDHHKPA